MTYAYKDLKLQDMKDILVNEFGWTPDAFVTIPDITRTLLWSYIKEEQEMDLGKKDDEQKDFDTNEENAIDLDEAVVVVQEENKVSDDDVKVRPSMFSPNWEDYVMEQFTKKELREGKYPRAHGLRRVSQLIFGPLVEVDTEVIQCPTPENEYSATAIVRVVFNEAKFCGAADASPRNLDAAVSKHSVANAEARAEVRAYRKALGVTTIAAEEMVMGQTGADAVPKPDADDGEMVVENQVSFMGILSERKDINIEKLVAKIFPDIHNIYSLTYEQAVKVNGAIQSAGNGEALQVELDNEEVLSIPKEDVAGFDKDWEKTFGEKK